MIVEVKRSKKPNLINDITRDEGFREYAYRDHLGNLTIGIGFMIDPDVHGAEPMPREVANLWLMHILKKRKKALDIKIPWWRNLSQSQQDALVNMSYQMGVAGLMKFQKMLAALKRGEPALAAIEALDSRWAKQTPERAKRIAEMLNQKE